MREVNERGGEVGEKRMKVRTSGFNSTSGVFTLSM